MSGPPRTPTETLKARGSRLTKDREDEPKGKPTAPICPAWLSHDAKLAWKRLMPLLKGMRVLTTSDGNVLARYCDYYVRWREMSAYVAEHGEVYTFNDKFENTQRRANPEVSIGLKYHSELLRIEGLFGLSPSARASLAVVPEKEGEENPKARFFKKGVA